MNQPASQHFRRKTRSRVGWLTAAWGLLLGLCSGCLSLSPQSLRGAPETPGATATVMTRRASPIGVAPSMWLMQLSTEVEGPPLVRLLPPTDEDSSPVGFAWPSQTQSALSRLELAIESDTDAISLSHHKELESTVENFEEKWDPPAPGSKSNQSLWESIKWDHRNFYSADSLVPLAYGFAGGAIVANTGLDTQIFEVFQRNVRNADSDEWSASLHLNKEVGNGYYTLPLFGAAVIAGYVFEDIEPLRRTGEWGERSLRTFLVGVPPLIAGQYLTGASRPFDRPRTEHDSHWHPFQDNNGVSGHAFMGAIPFLSAAKMTDNPWLRGGLYVTSTLPGLSRINDGAHYGSQVFLGWWLAFLAAEAVDKTHDDSRSWNIVSLPVSTGQGIGVEWRW